MIDKIHAVVTNGFVIVAVAILLAVTAIKICP